MDRLKSIGQAIQAASLAVAVVAAQQLAQLTQTIFPKWLLPILALVVVGGGRPLLQFVLGSLFEMRQLRSRLLGRQYIEGSWYIIFRVDDKPVRVGETRIEPKGTSLRFAGEDYSIGDMSGESSIGHYVTKDLVALSWPELRYIYGYTLGGVISEGLGKAQFSEEDGQTRKFSGQFSALLGKQTVTYEGWRVEISELDLRTRSDDPGAKRQQIMKFFTTILNANQCAAPQSLP